MDGSCTERDEGKPNMYNFIEEIVEEAAPSLEEMILSMNVEWYPLSMEWGWLLAMSSFALLTEVPAVGLPGLVNEVDKDGDVHIFSPARRTTSSGSHWIDKVAFIR